MSNELIERFARLDVATVYECNPGPGGGLLHHRVTAVTPGVKICGPATTAGNAPGDNLAMHAALERAGAGDVLVIASGSEEPAATWGALVTETALARGLAGVVTDGFVRDVAFVRAKAFGLWAGGVSPRRAVKQRVCSVGEAVVCGGVVIQPGDIVLADDDGVVVVPVAAAPDVLAAAEQRAADEARTAEVLRGGTSTFEHFGFASLLEG